MKLCGFVLSAKLTLALVIALILSSGAIWSGAGWIRDYKADALRDECNQLDYAVRRYGQNHQAVDTSSEHMDADGKLWYNMVQTYPASQAKLSELYDLGYLRSAVKMEDFKLKSGAAGVAKDDSVTFYRVNSDKTKYRIEVTLPNGKTYVTPGSSSF